MKGILIQFPDNTKLDEIINPLDDIQNAVDGLKKWAGHSTKNLTETKVRFITWESEIKCTGIMLGVSELN